jgi:hypothetical protein
MFGQDYMEGDLNSVDYSATALGDEAREASRTVQILEEEEDDEDDGGDDDGGGGIFMVPAQLH